MSNETHTAALPASRRHANLLGLLLSAFFLVVCVLLTMHTVTRTQSATFSMAEPGWVSMPPGARSAYLGIHGGTVPVSLLVSSTGTSLISFVGQTGNDFLALLRKAETGLPSILNNGTRKNVPGGIDTLNVSGTRLSAGTSASSLPVISLTGDSVFSLTARPDTVRPFGLSEEPARIEGNVSQPDPDAHQPRYHILVEPRHFSPRTQD